MIITIKNEQLTVKITTSSNIVIEQFKLHIDPLYNFLFNKNVLADIFVSYKFPIICKYASSYGNVELWCTPILD